uniref:Amylosucrase n=1 Tax=uncultured bacterium Contig1795 TaxID=1393518 RepID=W0FVU9_9BACT|nr:amylosucrase [uncultured bacterium Contig1795]
MDKSKWHRTFAERFARHEDELQWLYCELYHGDMQAYDYFVEMLYLAWQDRPEALRRIDQARLDNPDWYRGRDITGMLMYVKAFAGTLNGVRDKLDYIQDCGVNYLHLMPLLESPEGRSDGGYAVSDFRKVQPELGTMDDLAALADDCHDRGIALCLDFVMNHTSEDHEWARRAREGDPASMARYFIYDNWVVPDEYEKTVPQVFPTTAPGNFSWCDALHKVVMTTFWPYQWDLNYANPMVFNDMTDNMLYLCNRGVDIIRLDAVPYIWKSLGTNCRNLPQVHSLVRMMRMACEIVCPGTLLLGEVVMAPDKVAPYFGTVHKPECHLLYNVTTMASIWHTVATRDTRLLRHQLDQVFALPGQYTFLNYLRCHDDIGWGLDYDFLGRFGQEEVPHKKYLNDWFTGKWPGSPSRGELYNDDPRLGDARLCGTTASLCGMQTALEAGDAAALEQALALDTALHALMFTLSGVPVLYSGDEIAQLNDEAYHGDPLKAGDSRYLHRGDMDWAAANKRGDGSTPQGRVFSAVRRLEALRAEHVAFSADAAVRLLPCDDDALLAVERCRGGERLVALFNFAEGDRPAPLEGDGRFTDLWTGASVEAEGLVVPAGGFLWLLDARKGE